MAKAKAGDEAAITSTKVKAEFSQRKASRARNLTTSSAIASERIRRSGDRAARHGKPRIGRRWKISFWRNGSGGGRRRPWRCGTIRSPITGLVVERYVAPGELVKDKPSLADRSIRTRCKLKYCAPLSGWREGDDRHVHRCETGSCGPGARDQARVTSSILLSIVPAIPSVCVSAAQSAVSHSCSV